MKPAGYSFLMDRFSLDVRMPRILSSIHGKSDRKSIILGREEEEYYPKRYDPGDRWQDHIQFALKHEGVDLEILTAFFSAVSENDIADLVRSAPTGRYVRIAWFLYEWLTGKTVPVPDLEQGNYVPVLDPARYYTFSKETAAPRIRRQRIVNNLPGEPRWCPLVRKTAALQEFDASGIDTAIREKLSGYPPGIVSRAVRCLSARETRSSWEIEGAAADSRRATRFMELLRRAGNRNIRSEAELVKLQNVIVEDRYAASGFRKNQTYVGQTIGPNREIVHYVPPKPEDIPGLMEGWMNAWEAMERGAVHPVIIAAVVGFGFVFLQALRTATEGSIGF
jgi:hypothetical protein